MSENTTARRQALAALDPQNFGFRQHLHGWERDFPHVGTVAFANLSWPHNQAHAYADVGGALEATNAVGLLVPLQQQVWGFPPEEAVPVNILSILEDTGGGVIVAYEPEKGFNADGWLGFAIGMGTRSGVLYSHMLGVREDVRGIDSLGWCLKVLQGYQAVQSGHHAMTWTFDPMRGANARLNLEKLKAVMVNLTVDKYGVMRSSLYGDVPTDRFTAHWDLLDPAMHQRLRDVLHRRYHSPTEDQLADMPEATLQSLHQIASLQPEVLRYRIPGNIDELMRTDPERAVQWRQDMRSVLGTFMTLRRAALPPDRMQEGPIGVSTEIDAGNYVVDGFVTWIDEERDERMSYYLLRKGNPPCD